MLVTHGYRKEEGIEYDETFAYVAKLEAIMIFLSYAAYMGFVMYQMDVNSAFLNGKFSKEVYVQQPPRFERSKFPNHVFKLDKALYRLKQAPKGWYKTLSKFLIQHKFVRGFDLEAYLDFDYVGCNLDRKSISAEAEYVAAARCCAQVLWIDNQLAEYYVLYDKEHEKIVKKTMEDPSASDSGIKSLGNVTFDELFKDYNMNVDAEESPFDTESEIKSIGKVVLKLNVDTYSTFASSSFLHQEIKEADLDLESMPHDEIMSVLGNADKDDDSKELSQADEIDADNVIDKLTLGDMMRFKEIHITKALGSDPLSHLPKRLDFLSAQVNNFAKNLPIELNMIFYSAASTIHNIVLDVITQQLPDLLTARLKDSLLILTSTRS
uniref:Retrovirus-related Pol polyprotein from transposon TNT 1-94 n=1 Tax=Tanacetum cinerariifolium TaxID=118510 RepID=A0A6L2KRR6_TANCI|nr:retrovirus-related Pol polyprotein from transposon TNT 1-94 [Tanacetum cinerariifolium]